MSLTSVRSSLSFQKSPLHLIRPAAVAGMLCALTALTSLHAWAEPSASMEVTQLMDKGMLSEAAKRAKSHLKNNEDDIQMRFLLGVISTEQRKYDQAIHIFTSLTQDFPNLPEPYNNLAVLYAALGQERKATQILEQAIRTNPSYAIAHENLGDLHARMASDAYAKALQLDNSRETLQPKLSLIRQIVSNTAGPKAGVPSATAKPATTATVTAASRPVPPPLATATPVAAGAPIVETKPSTAVAVAATEKLKNDATTGSQLEETAVAAIQTAVNAWAHAWRTQNMAGYYAAYSGQFKPSSGTLANWKKERKQRIEGKPGITLDIRNLKVQANGDRATASFQQYYSSGGFKATTRKTLILQREDNKWRIIREETGR